jgi:hypothetical protein
MSWEDDLQRYDLEGYPQEMEAEVKLKAMLLREAGIPTFSEFAEGYADEFALGPDLRTRYREMYGQQIQEICSEATRRIDADRTLAMISITEDQAYHLYDEWMAVEFGAAESYNAYAEHAHLPLVIVDHGDYLYLNEYLSFDELVVALRVHVDMKEFMEFVVYHEYPQTKELIAYVEGDNAHPRQKPYSYHEKDLPREGEFWLLGNQSLVKIVASPVELAGDGSLCVVYMNFDNNKLIAERLDAFLETSHRIYES